MREFLGWQQPLRSLTEAILAGTSGPWLDLHELTVVLPSARSSRRLLEMLTVTAADRGFSLSPPRIVTAGYAPELFRQVTGRRPGSFARLLAWTEALARIQKKSGSSDGFSERLDLAYAMDDCLTDLAVAGLSPAVARKKMARSPVPGAPGFWDAFAKAHSVYAELLREWGYEEPHGARRAAIEEGRLSCPGRVILAGVVEMPWALREIVHRYRKQVEVMVFAPADRKDDFDELGCFVPDRWQRAPEIPDEAIEFVDGPGDQAAAVVGEIVRYQGRYAADEVVVGAPDQGIAQLIEVRLRRAGIPTRNADDRVLRDGTICPLLSSILDFLNNPEFDGLAALARHPDLTRHFRSMGLEGDLPSLLDEYQSEHFISQLPVNWPGRPEDTDRLRAFLNGLDEELGSLREPSTDTPAGWAKRLSQLLSRVYEQRELNPDDAGDAIPLAEFTAAGEALRELSELPSDALKLGADAAILLLLRILGEQPLGLASDEPAVELLGWLELAMDDAPALAVTAMNEGIVPASPSANPILPESVRHYLGLSCDPDRFARDVYVLHVLVNSRKDLRLIAARRSNDGHPLLPSRLLLQEESEGAGRRLLAFYGDEPLSSSAAGTTDVLKIPGDLVPGNNRCEMDTPPRPDPAAPLPESMNVTSFRAYLDCPYRYYLRHVLGLGSTTDAAREMDALHFGSLMHEVLQRFPRTLKGGHGSAGDIRDCLMSLLDEELGRHFEAPSPRIRLQVEVLRRRLDAFAIWQADWSGQGYRIVHSELDFRAKDKRRSIEVDGQPMHIHGRIDRVDIREDGSEAIIFDYKSSSRPVKPEKAHFDGEQWIDLQLPLYRHLVKGVPGVPSMPRMGYIVLPSNVAKTEALIAGWTEEALAGADDAAREVVRKIRQRIFWPPTEFPGNWTDEFADICRSTRFAALPEEEGAADEADA